MSEPTIVTRSVVQDGLALGPSWFGQSDGLNLEELSPNRIGLVYDWALAVDTLGRSLDPPRVSTLTLTLTTHTSSASDPGANTVEVWAVPEYDPQDYSDLLLPLGRSEVLVGAKAYTWGVGATLDIELGVYDTAAHASTRSVNTAWHEFRGRYLAHARWSGRLALTLKATGNAPLVFNSSESTGGGATLASLEVPFYTGLTTMPSNRRSRQRRDPISGFTFMVDEAVESGHRRGLWVRPESNDPVDPFEDRTFYPPPDESVPDDQVT